MSQINKHLLLAETQMATELVALATRFVKAKKNRLELARKLLVKVKELTQATELLHGNEPAVVQPVPPLTHPLMRQDSVSNRNVSESTQ